LQHILFQCQKSGIQNDHWSVWDNDLMGNITMTVLGNF